MFEQFNQLKQHFIETKVSIYNHLIDNSFDTQGIRVYALNRKNVEEKNTRKQSGGAHFRVTRWLASKDQGAFETYIYWTRAQSNFKGDKFSTIRSQVLNSLHFDTKVVFESENGYSKPVTKQFIQKFNLIKLNGEMQYVIPQSRLDWYTPDAVVRPEFNYECFKPEFISYYTFKHNNHNKSIDILINGVKVHFNTLKEFYAALTEKGAKANTIEKYIREHKNFIFMGKVFIIDPSWEIIEYKIRTRTITEEVVDDVVISQSVVIEENGEVKEVTNSDLPDVDEFGDPIIKYVSKYQVERETDYWNTELD